MRRGVITVLMMSQAAATAEPQQIDLDVPSTTVAATVQINVKPSKGAVLLYTGPSYDKPIRFPGPSSTRVVPDSALQPFPLDVRITPVSRLPRGISSGLKCANCRPSGLHSSLCSVSDKSVLQAL
jgi:hypothetical protein